MGKSRGVGFNTGSSTIVFLNFFFFFVCFSGSIIEQAFLVFSSSFSIFIYF